ncbi:MAG: hypothetical protein AB2693_35335, partial [Candidatus Thiodiazotropha sp.]
MNFNRRKASIGYANSKSSDQSVHPCNLKIMCIFPEISAGTKSKNYLISSGHRLVLILAVS